MNGGEDTYGKLFTSFAEKESREKQSIWRAYGPDLFSQDTVDASACWESLVQASVFIFYCSVTKYHKRFDLQQWSRYLGLGARAKLPWVYVVSGCSLAARWAVFSPGGWAGEELPSELTQVVSRIQSLASVGLKVKLLAVCQSEAAFSF